ncbi:unnamed protein product, partial [Ixodes hexagonus]
MRQGAVARGRLPRFETAQRTWLLVLVLFGSSSLAAVIPGMNITTTSTEPTVANDTSTPVSAALFQGPPATRGSYWLQGPPEYVSLSGDIVVEYGLPSVGGPAGSSPGGLTAHVLSFKDDVVLAKTDVPRRGDSGRIVFACGLVHKAGRYYFQLVAADGETVLARSNQDTVVRWPEVISHVPLILETYGSDVVVTFEFPYLRCPPLQQDDYGFTVSLVYRGTHAEPESWFQESVVDQKGLPSWAALRGQDVTLDCEAFDKAGYYQVRLTCADDTSLPVVSESVPVRVVWSSRYTLNVAQSLIASCHDGINIVYRYPTTCSKDRDKVRVYGLPRTSGAAAPPARYLFERRLPKGKHALTLGCHLFPEGFDRFCFVYLSVARNGAVFELQKQCRPWTLEPGSRVSAWGNWSQWSFCTGSCGRGTQSRYRLCTRPDGACRGNAFDTRTCSLQPCPGKHALKHERFVFSIAMSALISHISKAQIRNKIVVLQESTTLEYLTNMGPAKDEGQVEVCRRCPLLIALRPLHSVPPPRPPSSCKGEVSPHSQNLSSQRAPTIAAPLNGREPAPGTRAVGSGLLTKSVPLIFMTLLLDGARELRDCGDRKFQTGHLGTCIGRSHKVSISFFGKQRRSSTKRVLLPSLNRFLRRFTRLPLPCRKVADLEISGESPEDFMDQACLFKSVNSVCTASVESTPVFIILFARKPTQPKKRVPVATVSPQPQSQLSTPRPPFKDHRHFKSLLKPGGDSVESLEGRQSSCCSRRTLRATATTSGLRDSSVPLAASLSELSTSGTEDGFELDYYDYGCHDVPGSFFSAQVLGWPPFLPLPPDDELLELQLQHY